jgi:hypothetical protein
MQTVSFDINPEKEFEYHQLFCKIPGFNRMSLFSSTALENKPRIIQKITNFWDDEDKKCVKEIEATWRGMENEYFKQIAEITGVDWLFPVYHAYFLAFGTPIGFSNPFNKTSSEFVLSTGAIVNPKFFTGHELFHSHYYYIIDKLGLYDRLCRTVFIEGVAVLALLESKVSNLFPQEDFERSKNSYPDVKAKLPILREYWERRTSFEDFLKNIANETSL